MVIFHSYVSLPEGMLIYQRVIGKTPGKPMLFSLGQASEAHKASAAHEAHGFIWLLWS